MNDNDKQSIWCELTIENYKCNYPLLNLYDLCPCCKAHEKNCYFVNHIKKIKYFSAYPFIYKSINPKPYMYDNTTNIFHLLEENNN
jgi:hypothetical protein